MRFHPENLQVNHAPVDDLAVWGMAKWLQEGSWPDTIEDPDALYPDDIPVLPPPMPPVDADGSTNEEPTVPRLMDLTGLTEEQVTCALDNLARAGAISDV